MSDYIDYFIAKIKTYLMSATQDVYRLESLMSAKSNNGDYGITFIGDEFGNPIFDANLDNSITNTGFKAAKEDNKKMPPQYSDGTLRQRPNGLYEYRFKESSKPVYGRTPQICYDKRTAIVKGECENVKTTKQTLTLEQWLKSWYERFRRDKQGEKTQVNVAYNIRHIISGIGSIPLNKLSAELLQDFLNSFNDRPNARDKLKKMLNSCLEKAVRLKYIKANPCLDVEIAAHRYKSYPVIQPTDQNRIIEAIVGTEYLRLFMFSCCTGLRLAEALSVSVDDFNPDAGIIDIKGVDTATKRHVRQIHYLPELIDLPPSGLLFPNLKYNGVKTFFTRLFKKLGITAVVHSFRHTFASCCNRVGFNIKQIQMYLGHSTVGMTMDTYTHIISNQSSPIIMYIKRLKAFVDSM